MAKTSTATQPIVGGYIANPDGSIVRCNSLNDPVPTGAAVFNHYPNEAELLSSGIAAFFQQYQDNALLSFQQQANDLVATCYSLQTMDLLNAVYSQALASGLTNRAAYLAPVQVWGNAVAAAVEVASEQVLTATDQAGVDAVTLTLPAPPDPLPNRAGAVAIMN